MEFFKHSPRVRLIDVKGKIGTHDKFYYLKITGI